MTIALLFCKTLIALLGLTVPGYAIARALRLRQAVFAAFPLSALIISHSVTALAIFSSRITFPAVATILLVITVACSLPLLLRKAAREPSCLSENDTDEATNWFKPAIVTAVIILLATAFRSTLYPLGGFDTFTRWDALAREMLRYNSLFFYPPVTGADFSIYTMPDGFPPLVASIYWWLYAATGSAAPQFTAISVTLQLASIFGLTWAAARTAFGKKSATFTLLALAASPLLIRSVQIGQESGFLTLAIAGQICFALAAIRRPSLAPVIAAALFAALGAQAREYGPALALVGLLILHFAPASRSYAWRYAFLAAVVAAPWYLRNWVLTGSPLYPLTLPGSPHANPLLSALMAYYGEFLGVGNFGAKEWLAIGLELITGGAAALLAALPYLAFKGRRLLPYSLSLLLITALWLLSISKTSGGIVYSMRVLAPAVVILAIIAGRSLHRLTETKWSKLVPALLIPASFWGILTALSYPSTPLQLPAALFSSKNESPEFCEKNTEFAARISHLEAPATGILVDSPYIAVTLMRETRFRPVIIWSSEVSSILAKGHSSVETATLLQNQGITMIALNRSSLHNNFLFRLPFYRDGVNDWREIATLDGWVLFALSPAGVQ